MSQKRESIRGKIEKVTAALAVSEESLKTSALNNKKLTERYAVAERLIAEQKLIVTKKEKGIAKLTKELATANKVISVRNNAIVKLNTDIDVLKSGLKASSIRNSSLQSSVDTALNSVVQKESVISGLKDVIGCFIRKPWYDRVAIAWTKTGISGFFTRVL